MADPSRSQIILVGQRLIRRYRNQISAAKKKGVSLKTAEAQLGMWEAVAARGYTFAKLTVEQKAFVRDAIWEDEEEGFDD